MIDTSAVLSVLLAEPDAERFAAAIARAPTRLMSAVSYLESAIVLESRKGPDAARDLAQFVRSAGVRVVSFDFAQADLARKAYRQFGKGLHPAGLNLGDCCVYALSASTGEPVLHKGDDFARTDVKRVGEK